MSDKIITEHPDADKQGVNIDKDKYDYVRERILSSVSDQPQSFTDLRKIVEAKMTDFDGSPGWYFTSVKLDLEARGEIICKRSASGQEITLP